MPLLEYWSEGGRKLLHVQPIHVTLVCFSSRKACPMVYLTFSNGLVMVYLRILAPNALLLNAESNERDPHTSMKIMGEKLAKEVHRWEEREACLNRPDIYPLSVVKKSSVPASTPQSSLTDGAVMLRSFSRSFERSS